MTLSDARIGVDIGETFTDLVLTQTDGRIIHRKVSSTPAAPEKAVLEGVQLLLKDAELNAEHVRPSMGKAHPFERASALVLDDFIDGKISAASAETQYGVSIAANRVDEARTSDLRQCSGDR